MSSDFRKAEASFLLPARRASRCNAGRHKLLLVDDHPLVREGIRASLEGLSHIEIVGQASDGGEAIEMARRFRPDIVLMDISMPGVNGLDATRILRAEVPESRVVILSVHEKKEYVAEVMRAGACGYVLKDSPPEQLIRAIESVLHNGQFFSPKVVPWAVPKQPALDHPKSLAVRFRPLSGREREVLKMITQGFSNKEIARRLELKFFTVLTYRKRIMRKLRIHNVVELTKFALRQGIVT